MKKLNLKTAVIGVGNMGKNHARIYSEISHLAAVVDVNPKTARILGAEYNIPWYTSVKDLVANHQIDAVSVAVPTIFHYQTARETLSYKLPTLLEKPITHDPKLAEKLSVYAKKNNTYLMIGHVERFNPAVVHLKKLIDQGDFGQIISLLSIRVGVNPPSIKQSDVSMDLAIHDVDVFNYLLSEFPQKSINERQKLNLGNLSDASNIMIKYKKTVGMIQVNWVTPIKIRKLYITGTKRYAELDYINQQIIMLEKINIRPSRNFMELVNFSDIPLREYFASKKEPLLEELKFFLKHRNDKLNSDMIQSAIEALKVCQSNL